MNELVVSLNNNILKISFIDKEGLRTLETPVDAAVVKDTRILDITAFADILSGLVDQLTQKNRRKARLAFIAHPQDVYLRFITVTKNGDDLTEHIMNEIRTKFDDFDYENSYYTYQKIAPFVYQFAGVDKEYLNVFLELSNQLKMEISGIYPWVMLLPRYIKINDPAIFVSKVNDEQVVALSELNGIFYSGIFEEEKSSEELDQLVKQLSIYNRNQPITKIYTLNYEDFKIKNGFEVFKIDVPNQELENANGFELNLLVNYMIDFEQDISVTQNNLINLLPLPTESRSKIPMVYVGAAAVAVVVVMVLGGLFFYFNKPGNSNPAPMSQNNEVLSSTSETTPTIPDQNVQDSGSTPEETEGELKREDLKIRVENGAGINGAAGSMQTSLNNLGYDVIEIDTADAMRDDTLLKFKSDKVQYKGMVVEDTKETFPSVTVEEDLDPREGYDLLIILGSDIKL